jgi:broad specificity phosphatase PhoE
LHHHLSPRVNTSRRLILIKHSIPAIEPDVPSPQWRLSDVGKRRAAKLADAVADMGATSLHSSDSPKAVETAEIIAAKTGLLLKINPEFKEHIRDDMPFGSDAWWRAVVLDAIRRPEELVLGSETTGDAGRRFAAAVKSAAAGSPPGDMLIVAHGTVISMFVSQLTGADPVPIWECLGLPGLLVVRWPEASGIEFQENFDATS